MEVRIEGTSKRVRVEMGGSKMQTDCHFHKKSRQIIGSFFGKHLGTVWKKMTNFPNFKIFMG